MMYIDENEHKQRRENMSMYIREEDRNPDLYTETYDEWEDWMVGEVVYYIGQWAGEGGVGRGYKPM